jgi:hypothetical protein
MSNKLNTVTIIQNKIDNLNNIDKWSNRLNEIVQIKDDINNETTNINNILESLDDPINITKEYNIDKIITDFNKVELSKKIKYYQYLNNHIKKIESELFNN